MLMGICIEVGSGGEYLDVGICRQVSVLAPYDDRIVSPVRS